MSLALLQGYSSSEEENDDNHPQLSRDEVSTDEEANDAVLETSSYKPLFHPTPLSSSSLPSAVAVFSEVEVTGPPQFLNNFVQEDAPKEDGQQWRRGDAKLFLSHIRIYPVGVVVEPKAQLVGIHERVRSDIESNISQGLANGSAAGGKRVATVDNPNAQDAAELLRMCLSCGIPKTYSHAKGMVCLVCGDRPPVDSDKETAKKKASAVKDKEKSKRMKGQSSHATWKRETEMHLRH